MRALRFSLVAGMILHKVLWEVMKAREETPHPGFRPAGVVKRALKYGKGAALAFLLVQTLLLDVLSISRRPVFLRVAGVVLYSVGLLVAIAGRIQLGSNWANIEDAPVGKRQQLVRTGVYRYIRHPIYAGDLLLLVGLELALNSWLVVGTAVPLIFVLRQVAREESSLADRFEAYEEYQLATKQFIPLIY